MKSHQQGVLLTMTLGVCALLMPLTSLWAQGTSVKNPTEIWSAWGGEIGIQLHQDKLDDMRMGLLINRSAADQTLPIQNLGSIDFHAPEGNFSGFTSGALTVNGNVQMSYKGATFSANQLIIRSLPGQRFATFTINDSQGNTLFIADHLHVYTQVEDQQLIIERMDVRISDYLAEQLGELRYAGEMIAELSMESNLNIPAGAITDVRGGTCADRPKWPTEGFVADVGLIGMSSVSDRRTVTIGPDNFEVISPSSRLKNLMGLDGADVPWYTKFMGTFPPYNNDQHPYLIWNLYRIVDGEIEQIGRSGAKHAFLTINSNCTLNCNDGHILWPGCEDVYGTGTNDGGCSLGPRFEINPRTGVFVSAGSFFDQNGDGNMDNCSNSTDENRMLVLDDDLRTPNASYLFESWYVIRDDSNIFNSMGIRPLTPNEVNTNSWTFNLGGFETGPAIDIWVPPGTDPSTGSQNVTFAEPDRNGHFKLAVRSTDLGNGSFRYVYMLSSFDVDQGISELNLNVSSGGISDVGFHDADRDADNDWSLTSDGNLSFQAAVGDEMPWGNGHTFSFIAGAPMPGQATVRIGDINSLTTVNVDILVPDLSEEFLIDGFEEQ